MTRRTFMSALPALALGPPLPTVRPTKRKLQSPKGSEQALSYRTLTVQAATPQQAPLAYTPTDFVLTMQRGQSNTVILSWVNGTAPFQVWSKLDMNSAWSPFGNATLQHTKTIVIDQSRAFYRVQSAARLLTLTRDSTTHLTWSVPDL